MVEKLAARKMLMHSNVTAEVNMTYVPVRNLRPYHTVEKAFYSRDAHWGMKNLKPQAVARYNQRKESYNQLLQLIKKHNLHNNIMPVKKASDSEWLNFAVKNVDIQLAYKKAGHTDIYKNASEDGISTTTLFTYSVVEQSVDQEYFYSMGVYKTFGIKDLKQVTRASDFTGYSFLPWEETIKLIQLIAEVKTVCEQLFLRRNVKMSAQQFNWMLTLGNLNLDGWITGSPTMWVKYLAAGFDLYEVMFAFNPTFKPAATKNKPVPFSLVKEYTNLPTAWVKELLAV